MVTEQILDKVTPHLADIFHEERVVSVPTLPGSAEALAVWALERSLHKAIVWISDGPQSLETMHRDMLTLQPSSSAKATVDKSAFSIQHSAFSPTLLYYPAREALPCPPSRTTLGDSRAGQNASRDPDITGYRLAALLAMAHKPPFIIVTCIQALMQNTISPAVLQKHTLCLSLDDEREMEDVTRLLNDSGYDFTSEIQEKCQASVRGGLLDVWPPTETWPLRIEFVGAKVESIRSFNPADQRSLKKVSAATIPPATELAIDHLFTLLSYLPDDAIFVWSDVDSIQDHAAICEDVIAESGTGETVISFKSLRSHVSRRKETRQLFVGDRAGGAALLRKHTSFPDFQPIQGVFEIPHEPLQPDIMEEVRRKLLSDLRTRAGKGQTAIVFLDTQGSLEHFRSQALEIGSQEPVVGSRNSEKGRLPHNAKFPIPQSRKAGQVRNSPRHGGVCNLQSQIGILSEGFVSNMMGLAIVAESDFYGRRKMLSQRYEPGARWPRPDKTAGSRIAELSDVEPGDLVVHVEHGIGRYMGLYEIMFNGQLQEVLTIEYADNAKLHVPVSQAHLLSRYVGISRHHVELHHLGGKRWNREKSAAQRSILDLASSLLEIQAERSLLEGHAFSPDTPWQHEFEASFPYHETQDQHRVIIDVKRDMESSQPMDRLVCGDAGYGKTEVAMRAAFKAVMDGNQVAVLVPTTVLAQQHFQTFTERMSAYPIRVEMLSRFCTRSKQVDILKGMGNGTVDIVIGTHSLVQPGIRFKSLGLVVIDEEQRFGVVHKERLKQIRRLVDVLTLTATPIPRTLYMSMTGARDMSLMQTPPRERMAIETIVTRNTDKIVRDAILREINREGQVFYLHNRIMTIEHVKKRLDQLVPEVRVEIAHGRMPSSQLASVMRRFVAGEFEVLLCTTIIESGTDIPRTNTILIDRADRFGMADLYQLRGRVGRSSHKAYAYLLLPSHGHIDSVARKRIGAVKKYSSLSASFNLALRDLEIRGAGNILGAEQSGNITAIGFGLYCQLLKRTVARLNDESVPPIIDVDVRLDFISLSPDAASCESSAIIPYSYIEDERLRIGAYRKIAEASSEEDVSFLMAEFTDRFGPIPPPLGRLLKIAELRIASAENDIRHVETRDGKVMLTRENDYLMKSTRFPRLAKSTVDEQLDEIICHIHTL